jgi:hypothetical protein
VIARHSRRRSADSGQSGLAFFAGVETAAIQLPVAVPDRLVIDPLFATRDLVRVVGPGTYTGSW